MQLERENLDFGTGETVYTNWTLTTSGFTNGMYPIPQGGLPPLNSLPDEYWFLIVSNSSSSIAQTAEVDFWDISAVPFYDGRQVMKDNLAFLFRIASGDYPLTLDWHYLGGPASWDDLYQFPSNYAYAGFYDLGTRQSAPPFGPYEFGPFAVNSLFRNLVFGSTNDLDASGSLNTGATPDYTTWYLYYPSTYLPATNLSGLLTNSLLSPSQSTWLTALPSFDWPAYGITNTVPDSTWWLASGVSNIYGLPFLAAKLAWDNGPSGSASFGAGGSLSAPSSSEVYMQAAQPQLQTVAYYFTTVPTDFPNDPPLSALPGQAAFSITNTTPLLIASLGDPGFRVAGYAKQALINGYPNVFGYLGQYFEAALLMNPDGSVSTNQTGILSDYGDFFPTQPGTVALVTKPDLDTGQRGTGVVSVIKLQLDVNHDGFMDTSFAGPDNTSPQRPFSFWINNNFDRFKLDTYDNVYYDDDVSSSSAEAKGLANRQATPDYAYTDSATNRTIPCIRDLQDFARLWICGVTSNLLVALPPSTTITLSWGDVGNPNANNPAIDLFQAADVDGGVGYLTNATTAALQTNSLICRYIARVGPGQSIQLNASQFTNTWAGNYFIWCGVSSGTGQLTLSISEGGTNVLGQTSAYIKLQDIKQMYERWTVGDDPRMEPTNTAQLAQEDLPKPFAYQMPQDTNTPYILFVHGWNVERWEKDRFAESAFKRLYWQGYPGRFGLFRWPTYWGFTGGLGSLLTDRRNYDNSEFNAWSSEIGLTYLLDNLHSSYPGKVYLLAHSMGNVVAGGSLRHEGSHQVVNTYVATQAAMPAHLFDASVTNTIFNASTGDPKTPNIYADYFASVAGDAADRVINFYNTNDYALQTGRWELGQALKPDQSITVFGANYSFAGYPYTGSASYTPGSVDDTPPWLYFVKDTYSGRKVFDLNLLPDRYEVMAYAAQPRSTALGRTGGVLNNVSLSVDLGRAANPRIWLPDTQSPSTPYGEHFYHSAEFRGDYWQQVGYWSELLGVDAFRLK
ncbi:MAG TPA: alpha/beta hydrolase [Verrucomicrobiae bacterium]|nr:alpha/beta hydrolase [Verrucomicrobiae bacterium]